MFESLTLRNFQKHKTLTVDLNSQIVVLSGKTGSGKTAIIRALRWLCLNQPAGNEFITHGEDFVRAILKADGHKVVRRSGDSNLYKLDGKEFKAFGRDVPDEIKKLLNLTEENFQDQFDSPYWFSLTPGQVSKELNRIVNLEVIDSTLAHLASEYRKAKTNVELTRTRLRETKQQRDTLSWVPGKTKQLTELRKLEQQHTLLNRTVCVLSDAIAQHAKLRGLQRSRVKTQARGLKTLAVASRVMQAQQQSKQLRDLLEAIEGLETKVCRAKKTLRIAQDQFKEATTGTACPVCARPM